jgi:hypothetical protein
MNEDFKNSIGVINEKEILILLNGKKYQIKNNTIRQISLLKTQKYHFNYLAFFLGLFLLYYSINETLSNLIQINLIFISLLFLIASFFFKQFSYNLLVLKKNDFIKIEIKKINTNAVEDFIENFNKIVALNKINKDHLLQKSKKVNPIDLATLKTISAQIKTIK